MKRERIIYLDYLKTLAIFAIIAMHIAAFVADTKALNLTMHNLSQVGRFAVPMFLMVSGVLLLNRDYGSFKDFFIKRSSKITIPFVFWVLIIILLTLSINNYALDNLLPVVYSSFFNFGILWYFWMIIGVYLALPIINEYVKNTGLEGIKYFLVIGIIASIIYQFCKIFSLHTYLDFRFFIGPIFYILLGYYLHNKKFNISNNKIAIISLALFIVTSLLKTTLNVLSADYTIFYALNNHTFVEGGNIFFETYLDLGILEIIHVSSLFLLLKYLPLDKISKSITKFCTSVSRSTWGIYCSHSIFLILIPGYLGNIHLTGTKTIILIIVLSMAVFIMSYIITLILSKIPYLNKISGYN